MNDVIYCEMEIEMDSICLWFYVLYFLVYWCVDSPFRPKSMKYNFSPKFSLPKYISLYDSVYYPWWFVLVCYHSQEVLVNLKEKLGLKCLEYFSLVVEDVRVPSQHKFIILQEQESLRQVSPLYCAVVFILCNMCYQFTLSRLRQPFKFALRSY